MHCYRQPCRCQLIATHDPLNSTFNPAIPINKRNTLASYLCPCHVPCVLSLLPYLTFAAPSPYAFSSSPPLAVLSPPLSSYVHVLTSEITITATKLCPYHISHQLPSAIHNLNNTQFTYTHSILHKKYTLHPLNCASWYIYVKETNKMHLYLINLCQLNFPLHVSN
jgi:hypothetical protein